MRIEKAVQGTSVIRLEGVFDGPAARRVEALLVHAPAGARFSVDLTHVREFHDYGIAVLGHAVTRTQAQVALRGLRRHHVRVLRYFGVDTGPLESAMLSGGA